MLAVADAESVYSQRSWTELERRLSEERRLVASYLQKPRIDDHEAARFGALKMLACLRETFWGVVAEVSRASALSDEAAAAYVDEQYAKYVAARAEWEAWMRNGEGSQALRAS